MKLRADAKALLTLGPRMCRDKLVQAAMRMRQLSQSQTITLVANPEICRCFSYTHSSFTHQSIETKGKKRKRHCTRQQKHVSTSMVLETLVGACVTRHTGLGQLFASVSLNRWSAIVCRSICEARRLPSDAEITSRSVLMWALANTAQANEQVLRQMCHSPGLAVHLVHWRR